MQEVLTEEPSAAMLLLVGLGNPGPEHANQRHNIGFMAVDEIVRRHGFGPWRAKFQGQASEGTVGGVKVLALKPETYMNRSGQSVAAAAGFTSSSAWTVGAATVAMVKSRSVMVGRTPSGSAIWLM